MVLVTLRLKPTTPANLVSHSADAVHLLRADGGTQVLFDPADNVAGLDAFPLFGIEVAVSA
jgi:hypothetical protein